MKYAVVILFCGLLAACRPPPPQRTFLVMGTFFSVQLPRHRADYMEPVKVLSANKLYELEQQLTIFRDDSDISRLNQAAGTEPVELPPPILSLLTAARRHAELSAGAFDPTIGPLMQAWRFRGGLGSGEMPTEQELQAAAEAVDYRNLMVDERAAFLTRPGMAVDLGGIAKGYGVDEVCRLLASHGVADVLVNLGGNIRVLGESAPGKPWRVAVRHPFDPQRTLGWLALQPGEAMATSGNYEQFVKLDGERYSHIIDPRNGWPVAGMAGVTVLGPAATDADALSTSLFVLGVEEGAAMLARHFPGYAALFVPDRRPLEVHLTANLAERFVVIDDPAIKVRVIGRAP
ncbi:MAG: FAD:protein FMN transferase [Kiritimatiellia bacterium]